MTLSGTLRNPASFSAALAIGAGLAFGCGPGDGRSAEADVRAIREAHAALDALAGRAAWDSSAEFFTEDAVVMLPNRPPIIGREGIRAHFSGWPPVGGTVELLEVEPRGDLAYVRTRYRLRMTTPGGRIVSDSGKGVEIWRKQPDGRWLISRDISSSDAPER